MAVATEVQTEVRLTPQQERILEGYEKRAAQLGQENAALIKRFRESRARRGA